MIRHTCLVLAILAIFGSSDGSITRTFQAEVAPKIGPMVFTTHIQPPHGEAPGIIDWIEVHKGQDLVQTIRFGEDPPMDVGPPEELVTLQDIDCDGYKDLLVRQQVEMWGAGEYFLYRFDPRISRFIEYPDFRKLMFMKADCAQKLVHTYDREGWAGCLYEDGTYGWLHGDLIPKRLEVQEPDGSERVTRTIYVWRNGRKSLLSRKSYPLNHCHGLKR